MPVEVLADKSAYDAAVAQEDSLIAIDFWATWCGPCKMISPVFAKLSGNYNEAKFYKLDVDDVPEAAASLKISNIPTFVLFKGGKEVGRVSGANPKALEGAIKEHV